MDTGIQTGEYKVKTETQREDNPVKMGGEMGAM